MGSYKELIVWQKSFALVLEIYSLLKDMPSDEKFGLTSQIRRCSVSVPSNIAEGFGRQSQKSFSQFLKISRGSLFELETQLLLTKELKMIAIDDEVFASIEEISKMLNSFIKKIETNIKR